MASLREQEDEVARMGFTGKQVRKTFYSFKHKHSTPTTFQGDVYVTCRQLNSNHTPLLKKPLFFCIWACRCTFLCSHFLPPFLTFLSLSLLPIPPSLRSSTQLRCQWFRKPSLPEKRGCSGPHVPFQPSTTTITLDMSVCYTTCCVLVVVDLLLSTCFAFHTLWFISTTAFVTLLY